MSRRSWALLAVVSLACQSSLGDLSTDGDAMATIGEATTPITGAATTSGSGETTGGPLDPDDWGKTVESSEVVDLAAVRLDSAGNILVLGRAVGNGQMTPFVLKLDPGGEELWARPIARNSTFVGTLSLAVDAAGDSYVMGGGSTDGTLWLGKVTAVGESPWVQDIYNVERLGGGLAVVDSALYALVLAQQERTCILRRYDGATGTSEWFEKDTATMCLGLIHAEDRLITAGDRGGDAIIFYGLDGSVLASRPASRRWQNFSPATNGEFFAIGGGGMESSVVVARIDAEGNELLTHELWTITSDSPLWRSYFMAPTLVALPDGFVASHPSPDGLRGRVQQFDPLGEPLWKTDRVLAAPAAVAVGSSAAIAVGNIATAGWIRSFPLE